MYSQLARTNRIPTSYQPREDAQPNEQSGWLPPRLRRPVQPPVIRAAAVQQQQQQQQPQLPKPPPNRNHFNNQYHYYRPSHEPYPQQFYPDHYPPPPRHYADCYRPTSSSHITHLSNYHPDPRFRRHSAYENNQVPCNISYSPSNQPFNFIPNLGHHDSSSSVSGLPPRPINMTQEDYRTRNDQQSSSHHQHPSPQHLPSTFHPPDQLPMEVDPIRFKRTFRAYSHQPNSPNFSAPAPETIPHPSPNIIHPATSTATTPAATTRTIPTQQQHQQATSDRPHDQDQDDQPPAKKPRLNPPTSSKQTPQPQQQDTDNDNDHSSTSEHESSPILPTGVPKHDQLGSTPFHQVFACCILSRTTTRDDLIPLTSGILDHLGTIAAIEIVHFNTGKKASEMTMAVTFQEAHSAKKACSKRSFIVPSPFLHRRNRLIVYAQLPDSQNRNSTASRKSPPDKPTVSFSPGAPQVSCNKPSPQPQEDSNASPDKTDPGPSTHSTPEKTVESSVESCAPPAEQSSNAEASTSGSPSSNSNLPADHDETECEAPPSKKAKKLKSLSITSDKDPQEPNSTLPPPNPSRRPPSVERRTRSPSRSRQVVALASIHSTTTRSETVKMAHKILGTLGAISDVEILTFERRKFIDVALLVTFERSWAAREACSRRRFKVPSAHHYHDCDLIVFKQPSRPDLSLDHSPPSQHQNHSTDQAPQPSSSSEKADLTPQSAFVGEIDQLNSSPEPKPVDMLSSDPIAEQPSHPPGASVPQPSTESSDPVQAVLDDHDVVNKPPLKKAKPRWIASEKSPSERVFSSPEPPQNACPADLQTDGKPSPIQTPSAGRLDWQNQSSSSQPAPLYQVFATGTIHQSCTRQKIPQMINDILGFLGPISEVKILSFVGRRISREILLAITFEQTSAAREAFFRRTFEIPSAFNFQRNCLTVHRRHPAMPNQQPLVPFPADTAQPSPIVDNSDQLSSQPPSPAQDPETVGDKDEASIVTPQTQSRSPSSPRRSVEASVDQPPCGSGSDSVQAVEHESSAAMEDSASEDQPLWERVGNNKPSVDNVMSPRPRSASPLTVDEPSLHPNVDVKPTPRSPPRPTSRPRVRQRTLWIKGSFARNIESQEVEMFIREIFAPLGKIFSLNFHARTRGLIDLKVIVDETVVEQAEKVIHGHPFPQCNSWPLFLSTRYVRGIGVLKSLRAKLKQDSINGNVPCPQSNHEQTTPANHSYKIETIDSENQPCQSEASSSPPPPEPRASSEDDQLTQASPRHIRESKTQSGRSRLPSSSPSTKTQEDEPVPPPEEEVGLPLRVIQFPIPENCKTDHPSWSVNRLHYKLEKIRWTTSKNQTVIDSSWDKECLTLHVVPNSDDSQPPSPAPELASNTTVASESRPVASTSTSAPRNRSQSSEQARSASTSQPKRSPKTHRSWPFEPAPMYLDESTSSDFPRTLNDFLTTFFRLWEESRGDLRYLYDDSAVFSNILAKQGRKASAITKSTGWTSILGSISRLPALSNDPISDLIIDASPISLRPLRVICAIHGSFSEFPNKIRRAFDRTLILRPVDVHLHPSEGCLGLLKWIILSDTLTIRKQTSRATAITTGFRDIQKSKACQEMGSDYHQAREVFQQSLRSSGRQSSAGGEHLKARSPSVHSTTRDSPHLPVVRSEHANPTSSSVVDCPPGTSLRSGSETMGPDLALLQSQVKVLQAEIENLKTQTQSSRPINSSIAAEEPSLGKTHRSKLAGEGSSSNNGTNRPRKTQVLLANTRSAGHLGFGVAKKRLLLPIDLGRYLVVSIRGDILTWDPNLNPQHVQLVLPGASPTDIVDSAAFDLASNSLVVGSRISKAARNTHSSNVSLVKIFKSKKGVAMYDRLLLDDQIHENGVLATCLAPSSAPNDLEDRSNNNRVQTNFLTAGQDKFLGLWRISHYIHKKKAVVGRKDLVKIPAFHAGFIQSLCLFETRNWILSGGQDGKVFATDLGQAFHHKLCLEENSRIFDIQTNPVGSDTVMVTTGNKAPGSQFRYCDLRTPARPVISFGFGSRSSLTGGMNAGVRVGQTEKGVRTHRKGSLRDYLFSYPNADPAGGVLLWDLRFPASSFSTSAFSPSTSTCSSSGLNEPSIFGSSDGGLATQIHLESLNSLAVLQREVLTKINIVHQVL